MTDEMVQTIIAMYQGKYEKSKRKMQNYRIEVIENQIAVNASNVFGGGMLLQSEIFEEILHQFGKIHVLTLDYLPEIVAIFNEYYVEVLHNGTTIYFTKEQLCEIVEKSWGVEENLILAF